MYIELHARSAFSFLEGASLPEELASVCAEHGMPAMALLDRDGVYGAPRFHLAAKKISMRAHIGAEVTSAAGWRYPLLVESRAGYQNLCRLITRMKLRAQKGEGQRRHEEVAEGAAGLICLTGGDEGPLAHALAQGGIDSRTGMRAAALRTFGRENVYMELQRHFSREEEARNQAAHGDRAKIELPLLATNGVCHARAAAARSAGRFHLHPPSPHAGDRRPPAVPQFRATFQIARGNGALFADLPEAIANTEILSSRLQFTLNDLGYKFPKYPVPDGESQMQFLRERTREGMNLALRLRRQ